MYEGWWMVIAVVSTLLIAIALGDIAKAIKGLTSAIRDSHRNNR